MYLTRWWRERRFESAYRQGAKRDLARIGVAYRTRFKQASDGTGGDLDAALTAYLKDCRLPDLRLDALKSRRFRRKAERFGIDTPRDWWIHDEEHDLWYLTPDGKRQVAHRITEERIWAVKQWFHALAPVVALMVGLIGVIIGLVSIWRWP